MEPKKYWWLSYVQPILYGSYDEVEDEDEIEEGEDLVYMDTVTDMHPFTYCKVSKVSIYLLNYKLISCEEYNLWNELNAKG
jgi:hypothetical protein